MTKGILSSCILLLTTCVGVRPSVKMPLVTSSVVIIGGQLKNAPKGDSVQIAYDPLRRPIKAALSPTGEFRLSLSGIKKPANVQFAYQNRFLTLFFSPGDELVLTADYQHFFETLQFTGRGAAANNYLTQAQARFDTNWDSLPEKSYATATPMDMQRLADRRRQQQLDFLAAYSAQHALPAELVRSRQLLLEFQRALSLLRYVHSVKATTHTEPALPTTYYDFFAALPFSALRQWTGEISLGQVTLEIFNEYLYARLLPPNGVLPDTPAAAERLYARATSDFGASAARDQVVAGLLSSQLYGPLVTNSAPTLPWLPLFWAHNRDSLAAHEVRAAVREANTIRQGKLAPEFNLPDDKGRQVALYNFRGKVVYLDFWYSSCAPCLAQNPATVQLKQHFAGREVVFVYISVDRRAVDWQRALAQYPLRSANSVHLRDSTGIQLAKAYHLGGYPTYWIIGRDGRIWRAPAPHPSTGVEAIAALEEALAE